MYVKDTVLQEAIAPKELHKVVRNNTAYYDFKWGKAKDPEKGNGWNWIAFFFPLLWLAYRKMYKLFIIIALVGVPTLITSVFIDIPMWIDFIVYFGTMLFTGWQGNRLYYKHTVRVLHKAKELSDAQHNYYFQTKGGTHVGIMLGLNALLFVVFGAAGYGLSYLPTEPNIKDVIRLSDEGITLEVFTDDPKWTYVKKEGRFDIVEFTGYDYEEKKDVKVKFAVYLDKQRFEWKEIYLNDKKLNEEEAEEYQFYIEENAWY